jgi:hypothetical protein
MSDCILNDEERKSFQELQVRAVNLRLKKTNSEKEFIDLIGKEHSQEECREIELRRRKILHELELEGAKIEVEYVEKYRSKVLGTSFGNIGDLQLFGTCIVCEKCITATCLNCTACSSCVLVSSI